MVHENTLEAFICIRDDGTKETRTRMVLEYLKQNPNSTAREVMIGLGFSDMNNVFPRITELKQNNLIFQSDKKICHLTKKKVSVFQVKDKFINKQ